MLLLGFLNDIRTPGQPLAGDRDYPLLISKPIAIQAVREFYHRAHAVQVLLPLAGGGKKPILLTSLFISTIFE